MLALCQTNPNASTVFSLTIYIHTYTYAYDIRSRGEGETRIYVDRLWKWYIGKARAFLWWRECESVSGGTRNSENPREQKRNFVVHMHTHTYSYRSCLCIVNTNAEAICVALLPWRGIFNPQLNRTITSEYMHNTKVTTHTHACASNRGNCIYSTHFNENPSQITIVMRKMSLDAK